MKSKLCICLFLILAAFKLQAANITTDFIYAEKIITGTVTDTLNQPLPFATVQVKDTDRKVLTNQSGKYSISVPRLAKILVVTYLGFETAEVAIARNSVINIKLKNKPFDPHETVVVCYDAPAKKMSYNRIAMHSTAKYVTTSTSFAHVPLQTENYNPINESGFQNTSQSPLTTFAADVDRASYSNVRRFLNQGQMPPADAVRIEEMINYFDYNYPQPSEKEPISVTTELSDSPWNPGLKLFHVGLQAKTINREYLPPSNLVFLIDVSGSMMDANKLPLLKQAFKLLVDQLRGQDKVSIVVYAGAAGIILPPTAGSEKMKIKQALDHMEAGGSTAGGEGIQAAYRLAAENFLPKGNNRVILATDGDFNVGVTSEGELQRLIEEKRTGGVYLSIMGFGMGNYKDSHIETLANKGNGNYAYIDNIQEARKVFVREFGGTLFTVARDVKLQIEFNPTHVRAYRLIGYENRALKNEEFHDDRKDAGEMGSGHTVTAIYEIVPTGIESNYLAKTDDLKYQQTRVKQSGAGELLTLKIRYKEPGNEKSLLITKPVKNISMAINKTSENFRFAAAVAEYGLLLRKSEYRGKAKYDEVINLAKTAFGKDNEGYRSEFVSLVKLTHSLDNREENTLAADPAE